ncbi:restriction endonuclease subunit S [Faecalibacterium prausnitzii]|uniref:restriction endonuclease subunit S n=1 Tax=Faecalibacterium prausnitzii TaxID=853 RepID=UPI00266537BA|nr:restriction endonuclease subunit S [Faecalibacterium prausnitzii]
MALTKYRLGDLIEQCNERDNGTHVVEDVRGISTGKEFIETKANMDGVSLSSYKVVRPGEFAYVADTSRRGDKIALAFNASEHEVLISSIYTAFRVKSRLLLSDYLFMFFNRPEFDRFSRFNSWGSARETFDWNDFCDIDIALPPVSIQQKYVDIYNAMLANQQSYEHGLADLKLVCDAYIEDLRKKRPIEAIGPYIERHNIKNGPNGTKNVMGVSTSKEFREPSAKVNRDELSNYKVVKPRQISFVQTTHNEKVFAYAFNNTPFDIVVTSVNEVFSVDENKLLPEYLSMFFNRTEFDRYARFHSWGSARETFTWDDLIKVKIPIPEIAIQKSIVDIYNVYKQRKKLGEELKAQIQNICPILIKGSIEEGMRTNEA